jgi:hypothetical protein
VKGLGVKGLGVKGGCQWLVFVHLGIRRQYCVRAAHAAEGVEQR